MKTLILFLLITCSIFAQKPEIPKLPYWANDLTGTLTTEQTAALNSKLKAYADTTSNQVVFLMVETLDGYPLEDYSYDVAKENQIGTKKNNGILLLVVKNDRKLRIEVGYGLEGVFPDALSSSIIRNVIKPYFLREDYYTGINAGIDAIFATIAGEYKAEKQTTSRRQFSPFITIFSIIIFVLFSFLRRGGGRRGGGFLYYGGGSGGGFGGGFGGGGGFSGGGGSFGGGGSSGGW
ncbi:MAG: TPM domain-containing protein [Ignavibacteriaceae bacterium]|nr:TPM domain-containing protein [Ignavibacteriaceae bacterium]